MPASTFGGPPLQQGVYKNAVLGGSAAKHSKNLALFGSLQLSKGLTGAEQRQRSAIRNDLAERAYYGGMEEAPDDRPPGRTPGAKKTSDATIVAGALLGYFYQPVSMDTNNAGELQEGSQ